MASVTSAYYVPYDPKKMPDPAASFTGHLETVDLNNQQSAILFRGNAGIGKSKVFALSAIIKTADYFLTHSNFKSIQSN
jgi:hypothetical protein